MTTQILLYNRQNGQMETEQIFEQQQMDFFYGHPLGSMIERHLLCRPIISDLYRMLRSRPLKAQAQIQDFVQTYNINLDELEQPLKAFKTFQEFFIRRLKPETRPVSKPSQCLIAPADARLLIHPLVEEILIPVKGAQYSLLQLLKNRALAHQFAQGYAFIYRLAPVDYHRFCYIDTGHHGPHTRISGVLHSVNPLSLQTGRAVFAENQREYCLLKTQHFGPVVHMDVGALLVGRIKQAFFMGTEFERGQEKGYFELGGSTIIQFFMPDRIRPDQDILKASAQGIESLVYYGSSVGRSE